MFKELRKSSAFAKMHENFETSKTMQVGGLHSGSLAFFALAAGEEFEGSILIVVPDEDDAQGTFEDLRTFASAGGLEVAPLMLPAYDELHADAMIEEPDVFAKRLEVIQKLKSAARCCVVASLVSLLSPTIGEEQAEDSTLTFRAGQRYDLGKLTELLVTRGYHNLPRVEVKGDFSVRGGILDIYSLASENPLRLEFFDDELESIREFDSVTQESARTIESAEVLLLDLRRFGQGTGAREQGAEKSEVGSRKSEVSLSALLSERAPVLLFEWNLAVQRAEYVVRENKDYPLRRRLAGFEREVRERRRIQISSSQLYESPKTINFAVESLQRLANADPHLEKELAKLKDDGMKLRALALDESEEQRLAEFFESRKIAKKYRPEVARGSLDRGFAFLEAKRAFVTIEEITGRHRIQRRAAKEHLTHAIDDFIDIAPGDLVVHASYGLGKFVGLERVRKEGRVDEYLVIEYQAGVRIFVSVTKVDLVQRYIGAKGFEPKIDKVPSKAWAGKKSAALKAVEDVAGELLEVQASRLAKGGFAFPEDDAGQRAFDESFEYEDTQDQVKCMRDIKSDMQKAFAMDRLVCGDVGFGKTELAVRAAFKAVQAGKQVCVLVPTTILAEQHDETFRARMRGTAIAVESLSRFRTPKEQKEIAKKLKSGHIDVIIGTHRLLSKDVAFLDLGLLVIDEEQRFGVTHKERIKAMKTNVDVLTLSATPIPRTLHMSLSGLRDISTLTTPPESRMGIVTKVARFDEELIRSACSREIARKGQVLFIHNRVQDIEFIERLIQRLLPEASIANIHGQMPPRKIEERMLAFSRGSTDILVATTIVESGVDIPNANTLFVNRADTFGLSDLHQLRGRVGRSDVQGYAYFLLPSDAPVRTVAEQRLRAIEEFSHLGSGFKIAMKDLEIRGAGNVLGVEQSGHIAKVGYEMYCRLLDKAVRRLRGEAVSESENISIEIGAEAFLPENYVEDDHARMEFYKRISSAATFSDLDKIRAHLIDRYGEPSRIVDRLFDLAKLKVALASAGVTRLFKIKDNLGVKVSNLRKASEFFSPIMDRVRAQEGDMLYIVLAPDELSADGVLDLLSKCLAQTSFASK
ncbi:MAG: transcription-repair coupling factor [Planctomycetes bacterium]|nr:transcription-repair coupling factor [Planctomycetota bacterium]